jgi:hypothetical protein
MYIIAHQSKKYIFALKNFRVYAEITFFTQMNVGNSFTHNVYTIILNNNCNSNKDYGDYTVLDRFFEIALL